MTIDFQQLLSAPIPPLNELLIKGGALMIPLGVLNTAAWVVLMERLFYWALLIPGLVRERRLLRRYLKEGKGKTLQAWLSETAPKKADKLLGRGMLLKPAHLFQTRESEAWEEETESIVGGTERFLAFLTLAATLGTSFGLLGTVIGVSSSLKFIESDFSQTVAGLSVALYTTVGGLVVSIQCALYYAMLQSFSNSLNNSICSWVRRLRQKPAAANAEA